MPLTQSPASFSYPFGSAPGFDPSHPAAPGATFSGIASTAGFINLMQGQRSVVNGTPLTTILPGIAAATKFPTAPDYCSFSGFPATLDNQTTMAAIVQFTTVGAAQQMFLCSSTQASTNWSLNCDFSGGTTSFSINPNGGTVTRSLIALSAGVPYFLALSVSDSFANSGKVFFVVTRLDTGQIQSANIAVSASPLGASNGSYSVGARVNGNVASLSSIAAAMITRRATSFSALLQWAADPWSFWYPQQDFLSSATDLGAPGLPWWSDGTSGGPGISLWSKARRNIVPSSPGDIPPFPPSPPPPSAAKFTVSGPSVMDLFPQPGLTNIDSPTQRRTI